MGLEILIDISPLESRVALVEEGVLQEIAIERNRKDGLVGNIYRGRVDRVVPGMQAAFVDIGLERTAFLHYRDLPPSLRKREEKIEQLLSPGQELMVQVEKEPLGTKGARLTANIALPSHYQVYLPYSDHLGVSQRIEDEAERNRLQQIMAAFREDHPGGGFIARTAAEGVEAAALVADMAFLRRLWQKVEEEYREKRAPALVYRDLPLELRALRDLYREPVERVWINSREHYLKLRRFAETFLPEVLAKIVLYEGVTPLFERYGVEEEIRKALAREVPLKSGGYLVFDQTEAMTTIDVNTGSYAGGKTLEETIFKTNLEAAQAIARQIRLRGLGGIIIIDFIDMEEEEHRKQVLETLKTAMARDTAKWQIGEISPFGLVQMTRKRTRESLERLLCEPCPTCGGRGRIKTVETVCIEIMREVVREARQYRIQQLLVIAAPDVIERLLDEEAFWVSEIEKALAIQLHFRADSTYTQEQFDLIPMTLGGSDGGSWVTKPKPSLPWPMGR